MPFAKRRSVAANATKSLGAKLAAASTPLSVTKMLVGPAEEADEIDAAPTVRVKTLAAA